MGACALPCRGRTRRSTKSIAPDKEVFAIWALVPHTQRAVPDLSQAALVVCVLFLQAGEDRGHQAAALQPMPVVVLAEIVIGVLAGYNAKTATFVKKIAVFGLQSCPVWDIYFSADTLNASPLPGDISLMPGCGFVGCCIVNASAAPAASVKISGTPFFSLPLSGEYCRSRDDEDSEYVVLVEWIKAVPADEAVSWNGRDGKQHTVCRPRQENWRIRLTVLGNSGA